MIHKVEPGVLGEKNCTMWEVSEWMCMGLWWKTLSGENWSTERKTLYSVGGGWINVYGAVVEWYWKVKTEVLGEKILQCLL